MGRDFDCIINGKSVEGTDGANRMSHYIDRHNDYIIPGEYTHTKLVNEIQALFDVQATLSDEYRDVALKIAEAIMVYTFVAYELVKNRGNTAVINYY